MRTITIQGFEAVVEVDMFDGMTGRFVDFEGTRPFHGKTPDELIREGEVELIRLDLVDAFEGRPRSTLVAKYGNTPKETNGSMEI